MYTDFGVCPSSCLLISVDGIEEGLAFDFDGAGVSESGRNDLRTNGRIYVNGRQNASVWKMDDSANAPRRVVIENRSNPIIVSFPS